MQATLHRHLWAVPFEIAMLCGVWLTFNVQHWVHFGISIFTFLVCFTPILFERVAQKKVPAIMQAIFAGYMFFSMFLGEVFFLYRDVRGWDAAMHVVSGALIAFLFILWIRRLIAKQTVRFSSWYQTFFVIACGIMAAAVWELVEFASDTLFGAKSQDGSLYDTMTDLLYGTTGTIIMALSYELYQRRRRAKIIGWLIREFERLNPL